jgi:hypothetical protein
MAGHGPILRWGALLQLLLVLGGCGYHFSGEGRGPQPGLQRIAIPVFDNDTTETRLEALFANSLRREFIVRSALQVVPEEEAEAIFRGRIVKVWTAELAHLQAEKTIETRIYVTVDVRCQNAASGAMLWQDNHLTYHARYFQSPDPLVSYESRRRAEATLAQELAVRIHDRFLSSF